MKNSNKLISAVVLSTALVSSGVAVMANNAAKSDDSKSDLMSILIESMDNGTSFNLKLKNPVELTGYFITLEVDGPVKLDNNCFELHDKDDSEDNYTLIKTEVTQKNEQTHIVKIAVTSDKSLLTKNSSKTTEENQLPVLDIGKISIKEGKKDAEYIINKIEFEAVSPIGNSVFKTSTIDDDSSKRITLKENANHFGTENKVPELPNHTEDENTDNKEDEDVQTPDSDNDNTGGNSGGGSSSGGSSSKPEEEKPLENNVQLFSMSGKDRYETSTKISKTGWSSGAKNVVIVNGNEKNMVDGLSATPFATIKDAPLLLSNGKTLPASTISELKRLNPTNVYVIGGTASMPESVVSSIKSNTKATVTRIGGSTRYETSLEIAKQIDKIADVNKVYISSGTGEVDALSIASVAGREKAPILLTNVNSIDNKTYDFIRSESIKDVYFIGGDKKISNSVINQVDKVVSADVSKNRVAGRNRKDTNAAIIKKFYTGSKLNGVVVSKDDVIIDALTVGSFAAKNDMPVIIGRDSLSTAQKNVLSSKNTEKVYQAGGGVKTSVINTLKDLLGTKK